MQATQTRGRTALWIAAVYLLSFLCYVPMLLERSGASILDALLSLRYCFVLVPALVTAAFLARERGVRAYLIRSVRSITPKEVGICVITALVGIVSARCWSAAEGIDLFGEAYPSFASLAASCAYLYATALAEETAWRGFLFDRAAAGGRWAGAALFSGAVWAVWHIPMWWIRNSLGLAEIAPLLVWAALISMVLGAFYLAFRNVLSAALLHMTFNVCFLAPAGYNNIVLTLCIAICCAFFKVRRARKRPDA